MKHIQFALLLAAILGGCGDASKEAARLADWAARSAELAEQLKVMRDATRRR